MQHAETLRSLGLDPAAPDRPGVIGVWAWMMSRVADVLETEEAIDSEQLAVMGHSRRAKAALLAGARDERFSVILAHQSGTGGASLHRDNLGEPIGSITEGYPHWFVPGYADYADREDALPLDAHYLLALIAPRSVLLGNSWRDVWPDPAGAWRAGPRRVDPMKDKRASEGVRAWCGAGECWGAAQKPKKLLILGK